MHRGTAYDSRPRAAATRLGLVVCLASRVAAAEPPVIVRVNGEESRLGAPARQLDFDVREFRRYEKGSGWAYYRVIEDGPGNYAIRATYEPGMPTITLAVEVPERLRGKAARVRWRWRAQIFPRDGDECRKKAADSAAVVYLMFKSRMTWYSLKYVWSSVGEKGATCDRQRLFFTDQDTIILESSGATNEWREEEIDIRHDFLAHFESGDENAHVPDFVAIGIMSDGDNTHSLSSADYAGFSILY
jgi:hypothetical protein